MSVVRRRIAGAWMWPWRKALRHLGPVALCAALLLGAQLWPIRHVSGGPLPAAVLDAPLPVLAADGSRHTGSLRQEITALQRRHPGRPIGLYIWGSWCPVCATIRGTVDSVGRDHPVITVALQSGETDAVARHLASEGLAWHTLIDARGAVAGGLGFRGVPAFAVITPRGERRWPTMGLSSPWGLRLRLWLA